MGNTDGDKITLGRQELIELMIAAFNKSGEGYNGEYPFDNDIEKLNKDENLLKKLNELISNKFLTQPTQK